MSHTLDFWAACSAATMLFNCGSVDMTQNPMFPI